MSVKYVRCTRLSCHTLCRRISRLSMINTFGIWCQWYIQQTCPICSELFNLHKNIEIHTAHTIVSWLNPIDNVTVNGKHLVSQRICIGVSVVQEYQIYLQTYNIPHPWSTCSLSVAFLQECTHTHIYIYIYDLGLNMLSSLLRLCCQANYLAWACVN